MGVTSEIFIYPPKQEKHITGDVIRGIVRYHLDEDTEYRNIALSLVGKGYCKFKKHKTWYIGKEKILVQKIYVLNQTTDEKITLSAGSYVYPFEIIIPENVPASVITSVGEIKYSLVLKFKNTASFSWDKTFKRRIVIYPKIDSLLPDEPVVAKLDKLLYKPFSSKKKQEISLEATIDKGYVTPFGERNISFNVINKSDVIFSIKTELVSKTKYRADFNGKLTKSKVIHACTERTPEIPDNSESHMFNIIPILAPNICTVRHSEVINREYSLRVTLKLPMPHVNSSVKIPVFVGEILDHAEEAGEPADEIPPPTWEVMKEGKNDDD